MKFNYHILLGLFISLAIYFATLQSLTPLPPEALSKDAEPLRSAHKVQDIESQTAASQPSTDPTPVSLAYPSTLQITEPKFVKFNDWATRYLNATPEEQIDLVQEGKVLAQARRSELADIIQSNPQRALALSFPRLQRQRLPAEVEELLEQPISARGDLQVIAALTTESSSLRPLVRKAIVAGVEYQAFVFGRLEGTPTQSDTVLNGIAVDEYLALDENSARKLGSDEVAARLATRTADPICAIGGEVTTVRGQETMVEVAGEIVELCGPEHTSDLNSNIRAAFGGNTNFSVDGEGYFKPLSTYTEGIKKLIVIRVDFSDNPGEPFTFSAGTNMISELHKFYDAMSWGRAGFALHGEGSTVTATLRMPQPASWYGTNDASTLRIDARSAASRAGISLASFNFDLICFSSVPGYSWGGLGYVGSPGSWMQGGASVGIAAHELGHNYGLSHANFWDTAGVSIIGPGTSVEYGDKFDTMGSANAGSKHFNARYKAYLNWLRTTEVQAASTNGQYRIFPHDDPLITNGIRGLRVVKSATTNYWLEFRNKYTSNKWLPNGLGLRWAGNDGRASVLLDTTPGSADGKDDSALLIGRTFSDRVHNVHITPVAKGGTTAVPYIDVVVNRGSFTTNLPPQLQLLAATTNVALGGSLSLRATASDPNGDNLAYFWDFGDGTFGQNSPNLSHTWSATGEYVVQCTVSDMKGASAVDSFLVRVGSPLTLSISGRITDGLNPISGVKVSASSTKIAYTDSEGRYFVTGLSSGSYTVKATLEGYVFSRAGFANPVVLGPSRNTIDFIGLPSNSETTTTLLAAGSVWKYKDDGSNQGTSWRSLSFNDNLWNSGPAPLGYGDDNEKTAVSFGPNSSSKYVTTWFRHKFLVEGRNNILGLTLGLRRDDGGVVYLNNREVFRSNLPTGTIAYTTLASSAAGGADESAFFEAELDPAWLTEGTNVVAVEIHQASRTSSDIVFDLRLEAVTAAAFSPPALTWQVAPAGLSLSWPQTIGTWGLYSNTALENPASWVKISTPLGSSNGVYHTTQPITASGSFFKLIREN